MAAGAAGAAGAASAGVFVLKIDRCEDTAACAGAACAFAAGASMASGKVDALRGAEEAEKPTRTSTTKGRQTATR